MTMRQIHAYRQYFSKHFPLEFVVPHYLGYFKQTEKRDAPVMKPPEPLPDIEE